MIDDHTPVTDPALPGGTAPAAAPEAEPVGPFQQEEEQLLRILGEWWKEATDAMKEERPKRTKDWKYYAGDQWEDADRLLAEKQKRPALTLNMLLSIISAVEGEERTNRQEMKFYGEGQEDDPAAYGINRLVKWIMDQCGGQFSLSAMFRSGIICGEGWVVPEVDYFDDPNGKVKLLHVDDEEIFADPLGTDPTGDGRYLHRVRMMNEDELNARWEGAKDKLRTRSMSNNTGPETDGKGFRDIYSTPNDTASPKLYDAQRKLWAVVETWWSQIEPGWIVVDEATDLLVERTPEEFEGLRIQRQNEQQAWFAAVRQGAQPQPAMPMPGQGMTAIPRPDQGGPPVPPMMMGHNGGPAMPAPLGPMPQPLQAVQRPIRRFYQAFWSYGTLLERKASPLPTMKRFPYVAFRSLWDKVKKEWFGIARPILDPQRQHNVEQSVIVQLMQLMPKQSWMAPKGAYHDRTKWAEGVAQPGTMLEYNATRGKPEPIPRPADPAPPDRHGVHPARRPCADISGVNVDLMGQRTASDPGVVMEMRQKAAKRSACAAIRQFPHVEDGAGQGDARLYPGVHHARPAHPCAWSRGAVLRPDDRGDAARRLRPDRRGDERDRQRPYGDVDRDADHAAPDDEGGRPDPGVVRRSAAYAAAHSAGVEAANSVAAGAGRSGAAAQLAARPGSTNVPGAARRRRNATPDTPSAGARAGRSLRRGRNARI